MPHRLTGRPKGDDLRMGGRIVVALPAIMPSSHDATARRVYHHAPDRHFVQRQCGAGFTQRLAQKRCVRVRISRRIGKERIHGVGHGTGTTRVTWGTLSRRLRSIPI